ncbi:LysR family transcriptional regulator [Aestuariivirga litoralis]|uniref:LysR family transcriptional regulator n=1 Tax=Aestuariivirga litoralis TaxID=2650924 RepID=A0A2W2BQW0_9HYPH|nr:LysR substrate-binding domain-containing protein [Aestuariivirga litoralis]PZF75776.1 LysR family transcriptional regulator [Aestuariivirga litoralis]
MIPNLDIDLLKTFLAISDTGSFTRAAEEVNKTQSAVSMQMKRLEELLGRPLFARDGRASRFTPDGERLVEYARRLVALNDEAVATFKRPELTGTVRFGTPDDYADRYLPEILARFARTHPLVTVDVDCLNTSVLFERTKRGEMDLALVTFGCNVKTDEPVRREPLVWVTSARHSTHLLEVMPLAISHAGCEWRSTVLAALDKTGRKYRVAYSSPNSNAVNAAVQSGLAVGAVPEMCVRPGMRVLTEKDGFPSLGEFQIGLMRKPGRASSAVDALARHVAESLGNLSPGMIAAE